MSKKQMLICPYCGDAQAAVDRCRACGGLFEPLSRQATHNAMGPWFVRSESRPFQPGCSYETIVKMIERGHITKLSIIRGPTTKQFWTVARRIAGVAHLLGYCHNCDAPVDAEDHGCHSCGVPFGAYLDRNYMGLPEVKLLPWEAPADDLGGARAEPNRMMGFRPSGTSVGISSFASDDELQRGGMGVPGPHASSSVSPSMGVMSPTLYAPPAHALAAGSNVDPQAAQAEVAQRILRRRLDEQKRTIRLLAVAVVMLAILTIIIVAALAKNRRSQSEAAPTTHTGPQNTRTSTDIATPVKTGQADTETTTQPEAQPASAPQVDHFGEYKAALELLAEARRTGRQTKDRIVDYESVVGTLTQLKSDLGWEHPEDLNETILAAQRELERLKLEAFFP